MGGMSVPQVRISLHLITYEKDCLSMALQAPILTSKLFLEGRERRAPTVQVTEVAEDEVTAQGMPSMVMDGVSKSRFLPLRVMGYPPKTSPLVSDSVSTMGVWSSLKVMELARVNVLPPSS